MQSAEDKNKMNEVKISRIKAVKLWLLVQIESKDSKKDGVDDICAKYAAINLKDVIHDETSNTLAEGCVRFKHNKKLSEGKIIFSAGHRLLVEQKLQQLTMKEEEVIEKPLKRNNRYFLVQFHKDSKNIVQAVLPEKHVSWPTDIDDNQRQVVIHDGVQKRIATVLHCNEDKKMIMTEFQKLKISGFEEGFDENEDIGKNVTDDVHAILLYTCGPANVIYTVVNLSKTFCHSGNRYSEAVAYLTDGRNVYQAIVVRMSKNVDELYDTLQCIKSHCLCMDFPLDIDLSDPEAVPPINFQSLCGTVETFERFSGGKPYALLDIQLNEMESRMKEESSILVESLDVLENAKQVLLEREALLEAN